MKDYYALPTMKDFIWGEFMKPLHISTFQLAKAIAVPEAEVQAVLDGKKKVDADLSIRLGKYFGMSEDFFVRLQDDIDARNAKRKNEKIFAKIKPFPRKEQNDISLA